MTCIALSIERETKVSEAVAVWLQKHLRAMEGDDVHASPVASPSSAPEGGEQGGRDTLTESEFAALKRKEIKQAQETDTLAVMVHHALYLLLPCQPVKFHFVWGRFMRFYNATSLDQ